MKVSTIEEIHKILKDRAEAADSDYYKFREELREKYGTNWFSNEATEEETEELKKRKEEMYKVFELLKTFEENEW